MKFTDRFKIRPASYSFFASWEYNKEEWYNNYILGNRPEPNQAMLMGTKVGDSIGTPDSLVPTLTPPGVKEYEMRANLGDIYLIGFADHYCKETKVLHENKTTTNDKKWTQKSVDEHKQLDMYALLLFLQNKTPPAEVKMYLNYIPVVEGGDMLLHLPEPATYVQYETKRTNLQIAEYAEYIKSTVKEMEAYVRARKTTTGK